MASEVVFSDLNRDAVQQSNGVYISKSDHRSYKSVTLSNGVRAMLIRDPLCEMASAALLVEVGSSHDPEDIPGLAHFLEHMLFLGTEKYPDENSYNEFLHDHGGMSNAYTSADATNYHFEVAPDHLEGALDRFASFFTCPLFTEGATSRELQAVDAEHAKNLQSDAWRMYQLKKSTSSPGHPFHKFGTGDSRTLRDIPAEKGINVRERLLQFHSEHYSAGRMHLVIYGVDPLETLEEWARAKFSDIKNNGSSAPTFPTHPFEGRTKLRVTAVPVKDARYIDVEWAIPSQRKDWRAKSGRYLSHLIGHEGEGSLLSHLKARGWATDLNAGEMDSHPDWASFGVHIGLSEEGLQHVDEIIDVIYSYVGMLRAVGPQEWVWHEVCIAAASSFRFQSMGGAFDYVTRVAESLAEYPAELAIAAPNLYFSYDPAGISSILAYLTPENSRVRVVSKTAADVATQSEQWYGTKHIVDSVPEAHLQRWKKACDAYAAFTAARASGSAPAHSLEPSAPVLQLPAKNDFLATDFELRHPVFAGKSIEQITTERGGREPEGLLEPEPNCLLDDDRGMLWWHMDDYFAVPKLYTKFEIVTPAAALTARNSAMSDLFVRLLKESLNEFAYAATVASLNYEIEQGTSGFIVTLGGFSHKLGVLARKITERMVALSFTDQQFAIEKDRAARALANFSKEQPYQHAIYGSSLAVTSPRYSVDERLAELETVTADELRAFASTVFARAYTMALACGNATEAEARQLAENVLAPLAGVSKPLPLAMRRIQRVVALPSPVIVPCGGDRSLTLAFNVNFEQPARNSDDPNNAIEMLIQIGAQQRGPHCRGNAMADLGAHLLAEPFFDVLRTQQQLGYIVHASLKSELLVDNLRFILQSNKVSAQELVKRTQAFLATFPDKVAGMPAERFAANVQALIAQKRDGPKNLSALMRTLWPEVQTGAFDFKRASSEIAALQTIAQDEMAAWLREHLLATGKHRRVFISSVERKIAPKAAADAAVAATASAAVSAATPIVSPTTADTMKSPTQEDTLAGEGAVPPTLPAVDSAAASAVPTGVEVTVSMPTVAGLVHGLSTITQNGGDLTLDRVRELAESVGVSIDWAAAQETGSVQLIAATDDATLVRTLLPLYAPSGYVHAAAWRASASRS